MPYDLSHIFLTERSTAIRPKLTGGSLTGNGSPSAQICVYDPSSAVIAAMKTNTAD